VRLISRTLSALLLITYERLQPMDIIMHKPAASPKRNPVDLQPLCKVAV